MESEDVTLRDIRIAGHELPDGKRYAEAFCVELDQIVCVFCLEGEEERALITRAQTLLDVRNGPPPLTADEVRTKYYELLSEVEDAVPGEDSHQTALRILRERAHSSLGHGGVSIESEA